MQQTEIEVVFNKDGKLFSDLIKDIIINKQKLLPVTNIGKNKNERLLTGLVFCGECGAPMRTISNPTRYYLMCSNRKKHNGQCNSHSIRESTVINAILTQLYVIVKNIDEKELLFLYKDNNSAKLLSSLENRIAEDKSTLLSLYKDKFRGIIDEDDYIFISEDLKKEIVFYENQLDCLSELSQEYYSSCEIKKYISDILNFEKINKPFLKLLVNKILIYNKKKIVVEFNFKIQ